MGWQDAKPHRCDPMKARRRHAMRVAIAALGLALFPAAAGAMSLEDALALAYQANPQLVAARAQLRAVDEGVPQALGGWKPQVVVSGSIGKGQVKQYYGDYPGNTQNLSTTTYYPHLTPSNAAVQITQPVYSGSTGPAVDRAEATVRAQRANLEATEQQVMLQAVGAYLGVLQNQQIVAANRGNLDVLRRERDAARERASLRQGTRTDLAQAETRLAGARASLQQAQANLQSAGATFEQVIGEKPVALKMPPPPAVPVNNRDGVLTTAGAANPSVVAAEQQIKASEHAIDAATGQLLPSVSLQALSQRTYELGTGYGFTQVQSQVTANVQVPLYEAGIVSSQVRQAKQTYAQNRALRDNARKQAVSSAQQALDQLDGAQARVVAQRESVAAGEVALDGVKAEFGAGQRTLYDVLQAQQDLFTAQVGLTQAEIDQLNASYQVIAAVGKLTARDLRLPVELYDPETHYKDVRDRWFGLGGQIDKD
jgi:TolC family type I secretion outer membrane protein